MARNASKKIWLSCGLARVALLSFLVLVVGLARAETMYFIGNGGGVTVEIEEGNGIGGNALFRIHGRDGRTDERSVAVRRSSKGWESAFSGDESYGEFLLVRIEPAKKDRWKVAASGASLGAADESALNGNYRAVSERDMIALTQRLFEAADTSLNRAYKVLVAKVPAPEADVLRQEQRDWLASRDDSAASYAQIDSSADFGDASSPSLAYWRWRTEFTVRRAAYLRAYDGSMVPPSVGGEYRDFQGGILNVQLRADGNLTFDLEVVRGPTAHTGELAGEAKRQPDGSWLFSDNGAYDEKNPCELRLIRDPPTRLRVSARNTQPYHGARAWFEGLYLKVDNLRQPLAE